MLCINILHRKVITPNPYGLYKLLDLTNNTFLTKFHNKATKNLYNDFLININVVSSEEKK